MEKIIFLITLVLLVSCTTLEERKENYRQKGWSEKIVERVVEGSISPGMTREQVQESWGKPYEINRTLNLGQEPIEQWVYKIGSFNFNFVYFMGGICVSIST